MSKRINFAYGPMTINGIAVTRAKVEDLNTTFNLAMCFCSCPLPLASIISEYRRSWCLCGCLNQEVEVHYDDCPNANKDRFLRVVTDKEIEQYKALG